MKRKGRDRVASEWPLVLARMSMVLFVALITSSHDCIAADYPGEHTDKAFAALLSMPGAEPQGGRWIFPRPADFTPSDEKALIAYLARQIDTGANVNAFRHHGSMLHHAIRAGLTATADWLLDHGGDPHLKISDGGENALSLAVRFGHEALAQRLRDEFQVERQPTQDELYVWPPRVMSPGDIARLVENGDQNGVSWARAVLSYASFSPIPSAEDDNDKRREATSGAKERRRWNELSAALSDGAFVHVLDDADAFGSYVRLHRLRPDLLAQALDRLPSNLIERRLNDAVLVFAHSSEPVYAEAQTRAVWRVLWGKAATPIDYSAIPYLPGMIDPSLWDELFASGFANRDAESALGCMLARMPAAGMISLWPQIEKHFSNIDDVAPRMILAGMRLRDSRWCAGSATADVSEKLNFLVSRGIVQPVSGINRVGWRYEYASDALKQATAPFLPAATSGPTPPRIVDAESNCRFELTDAWFKALKDYPVLNLPPDEDRARMTTVQLIAIPGREKCALLLGGHRMWIEEFPSGWVDGFDGIDFEPQPSCPDPVDVNEIWLEADGNIIRYRADVGRDYSETRVASVRDSITGRTYFMQVGEQYGRCVGDERLPPLYEWAEEDGETALRRVVNTELEEALHAQCEQTDRGVICGGIAALSPLAISHRYDAIAHPTRADAYRPLSINAFIQAFREEQYAAYLAAAIALDTATLTRLEAQDVPPHWSAVAFSQVVGSTMSRLDKRQRIARLFHDDARFVQATGGIAFEVLLDWLTLDEWARLLKAMRAAPSEWMSKGPTLDRERAADRGNNVLACMIDHANGLICGESIEPSDIQ